MNSYSKENPDKNAIQKTKDKLEEYHYNAYKNLVKTSFFLNAAGITAVVASLALKFNSSDCKTMMFMPTGTNTISNKFVENLNESLLWFLISLFLMVVCVFIEYLSYFPRRKKEEIHLAENQTCCFCEYLIKLCTFVMFVTLVFSFIFLIYAGFLFYNTQI